MRAAQQQVERIYRDGLTPEQRAQARAALDASAQPMQADLPLRVKS